ncbi:hypothetical protein THMIRHAM_17900 [Thiomicrorhabdus immobilis]|uniref:Transposase DDE domain-containing protein n=1 Tax=Thiomicrorhabdus immobilis TaxID=2791037 RepID=A0ABN6D1J9_9GAMM|nr:hypothetical protein [Thiomicrorhabdus immobilis]BCN94005.1 hypothetical protein THMIRHAM_17900 [Thiomicrorhabdus immobilis]
MENSIHTELETVACKIVASSDPNSANDSRNSPVQSLEAFQSSDGLPIQAPNHNGICDEPAYLFWKIQSRLAKLSHRLRLEKRIIIDADNHSNHALLNREKPIKPLQDKG